MGNTSACAEKSGSWPTSSMMRGKYLRVRGEENIINGLINGIKEIPPRARRRGCPRARHEGAGGNTSACAEKSVLPPGRRQQGWKYLRVRGEEWYWEHMPGGEPEIPPRARRRGIRHGARLFNPGNTSACAEKRSAGAGSQLPGRKYLRVRGEEHEQTSKG